MNLFICLFIYYGVLDCFDCMFGCVYCSMMPWKTYWYFVFIYLFLIISIVIIVCAFILVVYNTFIKMDIYLSNE